MIRFLVLLVGAAPLALAVPAAAQSMGSMQGMNMPGMKMPMKSKKPAKTKPAAHGRAAKIKKPGAKAGPAHHRASARGAHKVSAKRRPAHAMNGMAAMPGMDIPANAASAAPVGHDMSSMPGMEMPSTGTVSPPQGGQAMSSMPGMQMPPSAPQAGAAQDMQTMPGMTMGTSSPAGPMIGTNLPAGNAPAPPAPRDHAADAVYPPAEMAAARKQFATEHGGGMTRTYQVMFNLAEYQANNGHNGYRWDGEGWYGSDVSRLFVKTEGSGTFKRGVDAAEVQALFSRAIDPYWNLQAGIRYDFQPRPSRTYATLGIEGLAPHFFETDAALFLSNKGDLLARVEGWYDQRVTQRLILQPRVEANFSAQNVPEDRLGSGVTDLEAGLRLRYEVRREFAPYIGVSWERKLGRTGDFARSLGEGTGGWSAVFGARTWF